jgi:hypothetical protein
MLALVGAIGLIPTAAVDAADPGGMVLTWNLNAVNALSNPGSATPPGAGYTPPVASIRLAMVQGAVYDAVNAIDGGHQPYLHGLPAAPAGASTAAAAATAAHDVLVGLTSPALPQPVRDSIDTLYGLSMSTIPNDQARTDGVAIGAAVAAAMLANRAGDGQFVAYSFTPGSGIGEWRPESPNGSDPFAWVSNVRPFTMKSTGQFRTEGPYDLASAAYAADYNEVKSMGSLTGSGRSDAQTLEARFFQANPFPMENRALREVAAARGLTAAQAARLFGMTSMSSADALIGCWDDKDHWSFWRPLTAIHEAANDGNAATDPQDDWVPLISSGTPPYPDQPSGYNCFSAAMMHAAKAFFGTDKASFTLASSVTGTTRSYDRFTFVLRDTIDARVWLGIHFRKADVDGAWLGKKVAQWVDKHYFEPVD